MRIFLSFFILFSVTIFSSASEIEEAAKAYVKSPVQQKLLDDMFSAEAAINQMRAISPNIPEDKLPLLGQIVSEELAKIRSDLELAMIEASAQTFTIDEIKALTEFYSSDLGASAMSKMNPFMVAAMGKVGPSMQNMQKRIIQRSEEIMK